MARLQSPRLRHRGECDSHHRARGARRGDDLKNIIAFSKNIRTMRESLFAFKCSVSRKQFIRR